MFIHIGLQKTGTSYLQALLWDQQERLAADGVALVPGDRDDNDQLMLWISQRYLAGRDPESVETSLQRFRDEMEATTADQIIYSNESLADSPDVQIAALMEACGDRELHVVITARDLGRLIPSAWQQLIKSGSVTTYESFLTELSNVPENPAGTRWSNRHLPHLVHRWGRFVGNENVHLVTVPPSGSAPEVLLERFCKAIDIDPAPLRALEAPVANPGLGNVSTEVLRQVNAALPTELRKTRRTYGSVVKRYFANEVLAGFGEQGGPRLKIPTAHEGWVREVSAEHIAALAASGCRVIGDLDDLVPAAAAFADQEPPRPEQVSELAAAAIAELLTSRMKTRRARARAAKQAVAPAPEAIPGAQPAGPRDAAAAGPLGRLRRRLQRS
ncbi:hypothetical protein GCM10009668_38090 [Nocardioides dubius]|uniref:Sulfotransferase family protein n=1 Tax=Nocardioides dubius TaxID=317019 RepID=A0ABN1U2V2_9ACTN